MDYLPAFGIQSLAPALIWREDRATLAFSGAGIPDTAQLTFTRQDSLHLVVAGRVSTDSIVAALRRVDERRYPLMNHRFRWLIPGV